MRSFIVVPTDFLGFTSGDVLELALAAFLIAAAVLLFPRAAPRADRFARHTAWCMALLFALPIALRLALLPHHPVPTPDIYDEFSHLLVADTLRHFRLANPVHPMHRFFETFFVLQQPTYSSIYPIGQGLLLVLFGMPWAGVVLCTGALCALTYWMLLAWTTPGWALIGGMLAVIEFGPLNQWMNSYWGGVLPAAAGCLVFGALPRLARDAPASRDAWLLGLGIAVHLLTRPYESVFLISAIALFLAMHWRSFSSRKLFATAILPLAAIALTLIQNQQVTENWSTLPYAVSQAQYGVPAALTFQRPPVPHQPLTHEQELDYRMQRGFLGQRGETFGTYVTRLLYRVRFYRFFLLPPLYVALLAFLLTLRQPRHLWVAATLVIFALGVNFFPAWQFHYIAAVACLFVFIGVAGLQHISRWNHEAAIAIACLCLAHFLFWYGAHLSDQPSVLAFESWDVINHGNPERRQAVNRELARTSGAQLVFVHYGPGHIFQEEWVWNAADIDASRVVWARDLGFTENEALRHYYPNRTAWLLDADARPLPNLQPYPKPTQPPTPQTTPSPSPAPTPVTKAPTRQGLHFEPIPMGR